MPSEPTTPAETMTTTQELPPSALPTELSISTLLANTNAAENKDHAYILAYTINIYNEAMKRLQGRSLWSASDATRTAKIMNLIMELNAEHQVETDIRRAVAGK